LGGGDDNDARKDDKGEKALILVFGGNFGVFQRGVGRGGGKKGGRDAWALKTNMWGGGKPH